MLLVCSHGFSTRGTSASFLAPGTLFHQRSHSPRIIQRSNSVAEVEPDEITDQAETDILGEESPGTSPPSNSRQLWLDLRGTSLFPLEALGFLQQILSEDSNEGIMETMDTSDPRHVQNKIDRILVSEDMFLKVSSSKNAQKNQELDLLYTVNDDLIERTGEMSIPIGKILPCHRESTLDPLLALDTVSQSGWVVVDAHAEADDESAVQEQVTSLMQFLPSTSAPSFSSGSESLFLPKMSENSAAPSGGVALCCPTKTSLIQMATTLQQFRCSDMMTTTTDSGIVLPTGMLDPRASGNSRLRTALVVPFEAQLWKVALDLQTMEDDEDFI